VYDLMCCTTQIHSSTSQTQKQF